MDLNSLWVRIGICAVTFVGLWFFIKTMKIILKFVFIIGIVFLVWYFSSPLEEFLRRLL